MLTSHEDIRYKVISSLRESIIRTINNIRTNKPQLYSNLLPQLEEFIKIMEIGEDIPILIKNEKIIKDIGIPDVEVFGGRILIEVKVKVSEFPIGFKQLSRYVTFYPYAEYAILTNYDEWEFYKVKKEVLESTEIAILDDIVEDVLIKGIKISLSTENVRNIFKPIVLLEEELHQIFESHGVKDEALFEAYRNILKRLYEKASEKDVESLFIKHTLMQMIVSSCLTASSRKRVTPSRACSGAEIEAEIVLPYLRWWETLVRKGIKQSDENFINSIMESVYSRAMLLDWERGSKEDVFRELYEILIDAETRRKIGEYYTPLWLVEYMTEKVFKDIGGLKEKIILDPFCGSGTFLVVAFYRKVQEGEDPDVAIKEVIGFDINPLAVSIARAELMIAYQTLRQGTVTPLIFNIDSATLLLHTPGKWQPTTFLDELKELEKRIAYVDSPIFTPSKLDLSEILRIEMILRYYFREISFADDIKQELKEKLDELTKEEWKGAITGHIVNTLTDEKSIDSIAGLIEKYGNGVWAVSITSLFAPHIIRKVKVDIVITNPPWAQMTEPKGSYGELIRNKAKALLESYEKTGQILSGSDISSVMLYGCMNIARNAVAFVMPEEVVYVANSYHGLGKILTFSAVKNYDGEIIQVGYDAFQHGRLPCIIFLEIKEGKIMCYSMNVKWKGKYSKTLHLSDIDYRIEDGKDYKDYIENITIYTKISSEALKKSLSVEKVVSKGDHIMGLFGGEKKKEAKRYAGLIFKIMGEDSTARQYSIKLSRTKTQIRIPELFLNHYWKNIIYRGKIFPFYLSGIYNVLLSSKGVEDLKEFLKRRIYGSVLEEDQKKVMDLIDELRQPKKLRLLEKNKYYVVYRRMRTFASFVLSPSLIRKISDNLKHKVVASDNCSYLVVEDELKAYYYSAILNYLAYKVIEKERVFERDQFLRPLIAILNANLEWEGKEWQVKISNLGKKLHKESSKCFKDFIRDRMLVKQTFQKLKTCENTRPIFNDIIEKIDEKVDNRTLEIALRQVCKLKN